MIDIENFGPYDILVIWKKADILHNFQQFNLYFNKIRQNNSIKKTAITIKNDLYGVPLNLLLPEMNKYCDDFFVATLQEGIEARTILSNANIYLLHGIIKGQEEYLGKYNIVPCVNSLDQFFQWKDYLVKNNIKGKCILHIDTGMSRHGISLKDASYIENNDSLEILYYMSHFYGIKDDFQNFSENIHNENSTYKKQVKKLKEFMNILPPKNISFSATDSAMAMYFSDDLSNIHNEFEEHLIRPGIGIIGGVPTESYLHFLKQAFSVYAKISSVSYVKARENIGYGINVFDQDKTIAVVNIGYGDGYMKLLTKENICIHINNTQQYLCKVIAINLNCSIIDITNIDQEIDLKNDIVIAEICGPNVDIRKFAIKDGCYQVYAGLGSKGKNKKTLLV